jgi:hypothetical protein
MSRLSNTLHPDVATTSDALSDVDVIEIANRPAALLIALPRARAGQVIARTERAQWLS